MPYANTPSVTITELNNELEISTAETVETIVTQLMEKQRAARAAALNKQVLIHHLVIYERFFYGK